MALSREMDPIMRSPVIRRVLSSIHPSGEVFVEDPSLSQAYNMGLISKVSITPEEAVLYKSLRDRPLNGKGPVESDQVIMADHVLTGEKSAQFKKAFPQIFPPIH